MTLTRSLRDHIATAREDGSDTARLVLADHLDEAGDHDRAELFRVQVELGRLDVYPTARARAQDGRQWQYKRLRARERELAARNPAWLSAPCPEPKCEDGLAGYGHYGREFCSTCNGTGDLLKRRVTVDPHTAPMGTELTAIKPRSELTRGFLTVTLPSALCWETVDVFGVGGGSETEIIPRPVLATILASPVGLWVEAVRVSDRVPGPSTIAHPDGPRGCFGWWADPADGRLRHVLDLPRAVWEKLPTGKPHRKTNSHWKWYPTAEAANDVLSRAVPRWARAKIEQA